MSAGDHERGKVFGILGLTGGLGAVIGGLGVGWLVEHWGYTAMFHVLFFFLFLWPLCALLLVEKEEKNSQPEAGVPGKTGALGKAFIYCSQQGA